MRAPPLASGTRLDHFVLLELVGEGGMGVVYRARDERLDREVALKILPAGARGEPSSDLLLREARTGAALTHPNIASVYEAGEFEGRAYFAMELIRGTSLRARLDSRSGEVLERIDWALAIARALACLHDRGLVHRDVKPENVMIVGDGAGPTDVKLLDFGLTRAGDLPSGGGGTVGYMSPEQLAGKRLDGSADVFAFGVVLQELVIGERASVARPDAFRSKLGRRGRRAAALVRRCLDHAPERRPSSGVELVRELELVRATLAARRHRWPYVVAAIGAVAVMLAVRARVDDTSSAAPGPSRRLTGHSLERPISTAALSWDGRRFAYVDDDGVVLGEVSAPGGAQRVNVQALEHADSVEALAGRPEWGVVARTSEQLSAYWLLDAAGTSANLVYRGAFLNASLQRDGAILATIEPPDVVVRRAAGGERLWTVPAPASRFVPAVRWSPDGSRLAVGYTEVGPSGPTRGIDVWDFATRERVASVHSSRLVQAFFPMVFGWSHAGDLLYALADRPGEGSGAAVWRLPFGAWSKKPLAPSLLLPLDRQYLGGISASADQGLLTVRHDAQTRVFIAEVRADGELGPMARVTDADFDERVTAWASSTSLCGMSYQEFVPHVFHRDVGPGGAGPIAPAAARRGWGQAWPTVVAGPEPAAPRRLLYWAAEGAHSEEAPQWTLVLESADRVSTIATPDKPREPLSVGATPPLTALVRCAARVPVCVLGALHAESIGFWRLGLDGGEPSFLFGLTDQDPFLHAWQLDPEGGRIVLAQKDASLATYDLGGTLLATRRMQGIARFRSIALADDARVVYAAVVADDAPEYRILRIAPDGDRTLLSHGATLYGDLALSPDEKRLAFVARTIDTDVWLTPIGGAKR